MLNRDMLGFLPILMIVILAIIAFRYVGNLPSDDNVGTYMPSETEVTTAAEAKETTEAKTKETTEAPAFEDVLGDQLLAIGIDSKYIENDKAIFEKCGIKSIYGAKKEDGYVGLSAYTVEVSPDITYNILIIFDSLCYLGVNGNDLYTAQQGFVASIDDIEIPETYIDKSTEEQLKQYCTERIRETLKYPDTKPISDSSWEFSREDNHYQAFARASFKNAIGYSTHDYYYLEVVYNKSTGKFVTNDIETLNDKVSRAYDVMGDYYGALAENFLGTVEMVYGIRECGIYIDRQTKLMEIFLNAGLTSASAYDASERMTQFCYVYASDGGFESETIFRRVVEVFTKSNYDCLSALGVVLNETVFDYTANDINISKSFKDMSRTEQVYLVLLTILRQTT